MLVDYHVHTDYSEDSKYPMEKVVKDAINLGMKEICFTDHVDYGILPDKLDGIEFEVRADGKLRHNVDYPKYFRKISNLKEKYKDKIIIKSGLEIGVQTITIKENKDLIRKYPLNFVILSVHQIDNKEFWSQEYQGTKLKKNITMDITKKSII